MGVSSITVLVTGIISVIVAFIVGFNIVGNTAGDLTNAADNISGSGLPLASLYSSSGVLLLIFMAFLFIGFIGVAVSMTKVGK